MARTLSMSPSAIKRREERAAIKAAKGKNTTPVVARNPTTEEVGGLQATITAPAAPLAPSGLLNRLKSALKVDAGTSKKKEDALEHSAIFAVLPLAAAFLTNYVQTRWQGYKETAPRKDEINKVLYPLFRIIARRLEISIELGPDGKDLAMMASALMAYMFRASADRLEIVEQAEKAGAIASAEKHLGINQNGKSTYANASDWNGAGRTDQGATHGNVGRGQAASGATTGNGTQYATESAGDVVETDEQRARRYITEAYRDDREYRAQHGLL